MAVKSCLIYGDGRVIWGEFVGETVTMNEAAAAIAPDVADLPLDKEGKPRAGYVYAPNPVLSRKFVASGVAFDGDEDPDMAEDQRKNKVVVYLEDSASTRFEFKLTEKTK